jgi:hypothetical protein
MTTLDQLAERQRYDLELYQLMVNQKALQEQLDMMSGIVARSHTVNPSLLGESIEKQMLEISNKISASPGLTEALTRLLNPGV